MAAEEADPDSILHFYRKAIRLRKSLKVVADGTFREYDRFSRSIYAYERRNKDQQLLVVCSFAKKDVDWTVPQGFNLSHSRLLLSNYGGARLAGQKLALRPYETCVFLASVE